MTLFGGYCDDSVSAGIWVIHTGAKSGGELVTLFGGYCNDNVSAGLWVLHTKGTKGGIHGHLRELHCIIIFSLVV